MVVVGRRTLRSRAAEVLDARAGRMLGERAAVSALLALACLVLSGGDLAAPVLGFGLAAGVVAAAAYRLVGPRQGRALAWSSLVLDISLASAFVYATGGATSPGFPLYLLAFLTPVALRDPLATAAVGPLAAAGYLLAAFGAPGAPALEALAVRLAVLAAVTVTAIRMQAERRALVREHDRRVRELSAINAVAQELTKILEPDTVVSRVVGLVRERLGHAQARVALVAGDRLLVHGESGAVEQWPLDDPSLLAETVRSGATSVAAGGASGPSACAVPLRVGGRLRGALEVTARHGSGDEGTSPLSARDIRSLEAVAAFAAVALENAELHQSALRSALVDPLTGLFNVRYLQETLGTALEHAAAGRRPFSLLMLDVDNLRDVNNRLGHQQGDRALREIARVIAGATRTGDIAARYGGDEFLLALPEAGPDAAAAVADRIRQEVARIVLSRGDARVELGISVGVASLPQDGMRLEELIEAADRAAYRAKARGRGRAALLAPPDRDAAALDATPLRRPSPATAE
jgi:diguanylate cyclase (GGDEF)-like protein